MISFDISDHIVRRIYAQLAVIVELSGLARFYTDPGIRICRTIVCFVACITAAFIASPGPLILFFCPFGIPALYSL